MLTIPLRKYRELYVLSKDIVLHNTLSYCDQLILKTSIMISSLVSLIFKFESYELCFV